jgi:dolichol-phosphate mannosyltransferase
MNLSIIIPVRNEKDSIPVTIKVIEALVDTPHELLIVYDKKGDNTVPAVKKLQKKYKNIKLINSIKNPGVTNSVKAGWEKAKGKYILIMAADDIGPVTAIDKMFSLTRKNYDVISGTRYSKGGRRIGGPTAQRYLSIIGNRLLQLITKTPLSDSTTGLKMFKANLINKIDLQSTAGWAFAIELAVKAQNLNLKVTEVPFISVDDRPYGGKSSFKVSPWFKAYYKWFAWGLNNFFRKHIFGKS